MIPAEKAVRRDSSAKEERQEHKALIAEILASRFFRRAPALQTLLELLFSKERPRTGEEIAATLEIEPEAFRRRVKDVRRKLRGYAASAEGLRQHWQCDCPTGAYELEFKRVTKPTRVFWQAHLAEPDRPIIVVCNELMFYQDFENNKIVRFTDVNPETEDKEQQLAELRSRYASALRENPNLQPMFLYLVSGELAAADKLNHWFEQSEQRKAVRKISRMRIDDEMFASSPILLGTIRTNRYIRKFLVESRTEAGQFSYNFTDKFRETEILNLDKFPAERANLQQYREQMRSNGRGVILSSRIQREGYAFGVVWRMRLPSNRRNPVTIIASDSTHAMQQIAQALVDDPQMKMILDQMAWPLSKPLPAKFELLFSVLIEPGSLDFTAGPAELIGWRMYS
jgi:hypothetical protein